MKTESHSMHEVLAMNSTSFFIPPFQRSYAWGKQEIERFFYDISRIIESELDNKINDKLEHFFGTIVIREEKIGFANRSIIVDGQQRMTTILLFLIALRDIISDSEKQKQVTNTYLLNNQSDFQDKIKLKQVSKDWEAYKALINKEKPINGVISEAYEFLKNHINQKNKNNSNIKFEHYITAIQRLNVAVIFLDERAFKGEDPQIIFETLNSLGKPLTLADLVRNFILLKLKSNEQTEIYEKIWYPKIEDILKDYTSEFFRDYLQYKKSISLKVASNNNTKELYQEFKDFVDQNFQGNKEFIDDIISYVKLYKWIISENIIDIISNESENNKKIKELLKNIFHDIKSEAFKPFVLGLLSYHQYNIKNLKLSDEKLISILEVIRTYLIRRRVLGLTQGENKNIVLLCKRINDIVEEKISIVNLLFGLFYSVRFPNDIEIKNRLIVLNLYEELKKYSKFILGKIEEYNSKVSVNFRDKKITIEHIMPQKLNDNWEKELGDSYKEIHKNHLHNIGNLILTEFNSEMGNKSFKEKKEELEKSNLNYRIKITNKEFWNKESILEHQKNMIDCFLNTFPLPDEYKERDNWERNINEIDSFSPLDEEAVDIVEGNKPLILSINNEIIKVDTWQEVFIKFLRYIKDKEESNFNFIIDNQYELFGNEYTILKWDKLKNIIEYSPDKTRRYKTLDLKTCDIIENLNDDILFIHINISAPTCITRISNIMEKLFIPKEAVEIKLKERT